MLILGISLGTTTAGIAVVNNKELLQSQTHSFREVWSEHKADKIVKKFHYYIQQYRVEIVVIKLPPKSHRSPPVLLLLEKVVDLCTYKGCMVQTCTKQDIKRRIPGAKNNDDIMLFAITQYPIITPEYTQALAGKNQYHKKLFEAVVAAHLFGSKD
ncbi:MAG: hypothetical protein JWP94_2977 [Mucilaginibacter sp.]|nr:hypothetical protein [Mucilaginibacter sp.]